MKTRTLTSFAVAGVLAISAAQAVIAADMQQYRAPEQTLAREGTCNKSFVQEGQYFTCERQAHSQKATCGWPQENTGITSYIAYLNDKFAGVNHLAASKQSSYC